jgi:hypothetical protein
LQRPAEHPPVTFPDEDAAAGVPDPEATEALWDEMFKHNRRQQERMQRALEERRSRGETDEEAFDNALDDLALEVPGEEAEEGDRPWLDDEADPFPGNIAPEGASADAGAEAHDPFEAEDEERHPLLERALDFLHHLHTVFRDADSRLASSLRTLYQGAGDTMGGLAQALSGDEDENDPEGYGLRITQLKRALRGAAFARGALFPLRAAVTAEQFDELQGRLRQMEQDIFQEISRLRSEQRAGDL